MRRNFSIVIVLLASIVGFAFSAVSAHDSVAHLDRQVHGIHCSYLPGLDQVDATGSSGCYATLMSPYSAVLRESVWGGVPVAIPSMSVFAFLFFWAAWMLIAGKQYDQKAAGFLFAGTCLPFLTSIIMAYVSLVTLGAACKLCMGIYVASTAAFVGGAVAFYFARTPLQPTDPKVPISARLPGLSWGALAAGFALGTLFVAVPFVTYTAVAPDFSSFIGTCGNLNYPNDPEQVLVPLGPQGRENEMIEVLDPLCVACGTFETRFKSMPISNSTSRKALLFPLDNSCNWMVDESIHPGACAASEAVLCAGAQAEGVLDWLFANREAIVTASKGNPNASAEMIVRQFPTLSQCIGSPAIRARLNLALRWAVKNQLQVLTPQIYVQGWRLCDEDTDIGLNFALPRLISRAKTMPLPKPPIEPPNPIAPLPLPTSTDSDTTDKQPSVGTDTSVLDTALEQAKAQAEQRALEAEGKPPIGAPTEARDAQADADKQVGTDSKEVKQVVPVVEPTKQPPTVPGNAPALEPSKNKPPIAPPGNEGKPTVEPAPEKTP
jgi:uncharacterized membrane protein